MFVKRDACNDKPAENYHSSAVSLALWNFIVSLVFWFSGLQHQCFCLFSLCLLEYCRRQALVSPLYTTCSKLEKLVSKVKHLAAREPHLILCMCYMCQLFANKFTALYKPMSVRYSTYCRFKVLV